MLLLLLILTFVCIKIRPKITLPSRVKILLRSSYGEAFELFGCLSCVLTLIGTPCFMSWRSCRSQNGTILGAQCPTTRCRGFISDQGLSLRRSDWSQQRVLDVEDDVSWCVSRLWSKFGCWIASKKCMIIIIDNFAEQF